MNRTGEGGIVVTFSRNSAISRKIIIFIAASALFLFLISSFGCAVLYFFYHDPGYNTNKMGKLQPQMITKVKTLIELSTMTENTAKQVLKDMSFVENETCFTGACLDSSIELLESMDFSIDPCEDFYHFSCGGWIRKNPATAKSISSDQFSHINEKVTKMTQAILQSSKYRTESKPLTMAKEFYENCIDLDQLEEDGLEPVLDMIKEYGQWPILPEGNSDINFDWLKTAAELQRISSPTIIGVDIKQNPGSSTSSVIFNITSQSGRNVLQIVQPSLFLTREYLSDLQKHTRHFKAYKSLIVSIAKELIKAAELPLNISSIESVAEEIVKFESHLAKISVDEENRFHQQKQYFDLNSLQVETDAFFNNTSSPKINWKYFLDKVFMSSGIEIQDNEQVIVQETKYFFGLAQLLNNTRNETLANYLMWRMVAKVATGTTAVMRKFSFEYNQKIYGVSKSPKRETTCAGLANEKFGIAIGIEYIMGHFDRTVKMEVENIVETLKMATEIILDSSRILPYLLKIGVKRKVQQLKTCIGFPEIFDNATSVKLFYHDLLLNETLYLKKWVQLTHWLFDKTLKRLRQPFDLNCWGGSYWTYIGEAYAYYDTARNSINFPVGLLQPPFFRKGAPTYLNFGGIGSIIGHEITHSLNLEGWIRMKLAYELEILEKCLVDHFSNFEVPEAGPKSKIDGFRTRSENFADHLGLAESFRAFKSQQSVKFQSPRQKLPGLESFTPEQLFFVSFSNMWCVSGSKEWLFDEIEASIHTPVLPHKYCDGAGASASVDMNSVTVSLPEGTSCTRL